MEDRSFSRLVFVGKGRVIINAHSESSAVAEKKTATTEKTKGFSPIGKNPLYQLPKNLPLKHKGFTP